MSEISREEFDMLAKDILDIKNDINLIKANTHANANILSMVHYDSIKDIVMKIADSERLCKALIICKNPITAKELCDSLGVKPPNIRRDVLDRLVGASLLTVCDERGRKLYQRVGFLDFIGFDRIAMTKYPDLRK
jgi:hypothetical protein